MIREILRLAALAPLFGTSALAQNTLRVPADQPTIQAAINAAADGDTILVSPGTYYENLDFVGKAITLASVAGAAQTIVDGLARDPVVTFNNGEKRDSILSGFTIRNGGAPPFVFYSAAGVRVNGAGPSIFNNIVTNNECDGLDVSFSSALIQGNTITNTTGLNASRCDFGGAIVLVGNGGVGGYSHSEVVGNLIENNSIGNYSVAAALGGGITVWAAEGTLIQGNTLRGNTGSSAGAIYAVNTTKISIIGNLITGNTATTANISSGGGIAIMPPDESAGPFIGIIEGNTVSRNSSPLSVRSDIPSPSEVLLHGNLGQYIVINNIIVGSSSTQPALACGTVYASSAYTPLVFDHNDIFNAYGPAYGGACTSPDDPSHLFGNISADPLFASSAAGDFHLTYASPAIDSGNNSAPLLLRTDIEAHARVQDATGIGYGVVDMGAFEMAGSLGSPITTLTLTPSSFYPYTSRGIGPFTLTTRLMSSDGSVPQGPVTFIEDGTAIGTLSADLTGSASLTPSAPPAGLHTFLATYPGQGGAHPATSAKFYVRFPNYNPVVTLTSSFNPSAVGQRVTLTVHVTSLAGPPTGSITFSENSALLGTALLDTNGNAAFSSATLSQGAHDITASYSTIASATITQVVSGPPTLTVLTVSPTTAIFGSTFALTAAVTPASPNSQGLLGNVAFSVAGSTLGFAPLVNGEATLSTTNLPVGNDAVVATYSGDSLYSGSTSAPVTVRVQAPPTTLTLTSLANPAPALSPIVFTAHLLANGAVASAGNSIVFTVVGASAATVVRGTALTDSGGTATFATSVLFAGRYIVTASFVGTASLGASSSPPLIESVSPLPTAVTLTASPNPAAQTSAVLLTANVTPAIGLVAAFGSVTFFDGSAVLGSSALAPPLGSPATLSVSSLRAGTHTLTAAFMPEPRSALVFLPSTSGPLIETILPQDFSVSASTPNISIQAAHHKDLTLTFTSVGGFNGTLSLGCANPLPPVLTCYMPATISLPANSTATVTLTLETDAVRGYLASNASPHPSNPSQRSNPPFSLPWLVFAAFTLPPAVLSRRTRRLGKHISIASLGLCLLPGLISLTACSGRTPDHTPPGTYTVSVTARGASVGVPDAISHTLPLALTVTQVTP